MTSGILAAVRESNSFLCEKKIKYSLQMLKWAWLFV